MRPSQQGFTLIELAIVMLVLTILAAGLLVPLATNIESRRYEATQKILEETKEALIGFAMSHTCTCSYDGSGNLVPVPGVSCASSCPATGTSNSGFSRHYLPCPDKTVATATAGNLPNDGIEDRLSTGKCEFQEGNFPWATLGLGHADAWGNHLHYSVSDNSNGTFSDSSSGFTSASIGDKNVCRSGINATNGAPCPDPAILIALKVPAIILSYGKNGWGAIHDDPQATRQAVPTSTDERENTDISTQADLTCCKPVLTGDNNNYVSRAPSEASPTTAEFDDLVIWLPSSVLLSRVCPSGGCP